MVFWEGWTEKLSVHPALQCLERVAPCGETGLSQPVTRALSDGLGCLPFSLGGLRQGHFWGSLCLLPSKQQPAPRRTSQRPG